MVQIPELRERLTILAGQCDEIVEHLGKLVDKAQSEGLPTLARYYLVQHEAPLGLPALGDHRAHVFTE